MTEKENNVAQEKLNLQVAESKLREASLMREAGVRRAKAVFDEEVARLGEAANRATLDVARARAWLAKASTDLEKPFTNSI